MKGWGQFDFGQAPEGETSDSRGALKGGTGRYIYIIVRFEPDCGHEIAEVRVITPAVLTGQLERGKYGRVYRCRYKWTGKTTDDSRRRESAESYAAGLTRRFKEAAALEEKKATDRAVERARLLRAEEATDMVLACTRRCINLGLPDLMLEYQGEALEAELSRLERSIAPTSSLAEILRQAAAERAERVLERARRKPIHVDLQGRPTLLARRPKKAAEGNNT